jgi:hypothetical protein
MKILYPLTDDKKPEVQSADSVHFGQSLVLVGDNLREVYGLKWTDGSHFGQELA